MQQWQSFTPAFTDGLSVRSSAQQAITSQQFDFSNTPRATRQIRACIAPGAKANAQSNVNVKVRDQLSGSFTPLLSFAMPELVNPSLSGG